MALALHARSLWHSAWDDTAPGSVAVPSQAVPSQAVVGGEVQPHPATGNDLAPAAGSWCQGQGA